MVGHGVPEPLRDRLVVTGACHQQPTAVPGEIQKDVLVCVGSRWHGCKQLILGISRPLFVRERERSKLRPHLQPRGLLVDFEECGVLLCRSRFVDTATRPGQDPQIGLRVANARKFRGRAVTPGLQHG